MDDSTLDLLAASLRADARDLKAFVEALAERLEGAFPGEARVQRRRGLLGGPKPVRRIDLQLGDERFELEHDGGTVTCARRRIVRGVAVRSDPLGLDEWIDALTRAVGAVAEKSAEGRAALERLLA